MSWSVIVSVAVSDPADAVSVEVPERQPAEVGEQAGAGARHPVGTGVGREVVGDVVAVEAAR